MKITIRKRVNPVSLFTVIEGWRENTKRDMFLKLGGEIGKQFSEELKSYIITENDSQGLFQLEEFCLVLHILTQEEIDKLFEMVNNIPNKGYRNNFYSALLSMIMKIPASNLKQY